MDRMIVCLLWVVGYLFIMFGIGLGAVKLGYSYEQALYFIQITKWFIVAIFICLILVFKKKKCRTK